MKSSLQKLAEENKLREKAEAAASRVEINDPSTTNQRRNFLKKTALGGIALTGLVSMSFEDTIAKTTSKIPRFGSPSDLKITDMRYTTVSNGTGATNARNVIIRIDTNQDIYGLGEVRDGADATICAVFKKPDFRAQSCECGNDL